MATRQSKLSAASLARQQVTSCGPLSPLTKSVLCKDMEDVHFNSTRVPAVAASVAALKQPGERTDSCTLDAALAENVSCEILFYDGTVPTVFVESEDPHTGKVAFEMTPLPAPKLRFAYFESRRCLRVWVERRMPLSSSHAGRRFVLAFLLAKCEVVTSRPFLAFAKKAKEGTGSKFKYQPARVDMNSHRACVLASLQESLGVCESARLTGTVPEPVLVAAGDIEPKPQAPSRCGSKRRSPSVCDGGAPVVKKELNVECDEEAAVAPSMSKKTKGCPVSLSVSACDSDGSPASVACLSMNATLDWMFGSCESEPATSLYGVDSIDQRDLYCSDSPGLLDLFGADIASPVFSSPPSDADTDVTAFIPSRGACSVTSSPDFDNLFQ